VSTRSYLSIGDVLTLLRQEFPDVTISKIRFLESQGLVNPERTPSGYRKFYEHDVERLRWVLRQQRENFLPLKVIKDRLDDEQVEAGGAATTTPEGASHPAGEPVLVGQRASSGHQEASARRDPAGPGRGSVAARSIGSAPRAHAEGPPVADGPTLPGIESEAKTNGASTKATAGPTPDTPAGQAGEPAPDVPVPSHRARASKSVATGTVRNRPQAMPPTGGAIPSGSAGVPETPQAHAPDAAGPVATAAAPGTGPAAGPVEAEPEEGAGPVPPAVEADVLSVMPAATSGGRTGATLSVEEVVSASGLEPAVVEELVEYGLLVATRVAGLPCFDQEAVAVATLAAGFARFGIEPRHLRLYKNTADREVGFIEQIVLPLVRQRNPEARVRATETADELLRLGQQLRASLVRSALGTLLDS
jgi:DNA-binding transcriptional MerR regulator